MENKHLGIIPDGGRRWAAKNRWPLLESYNLSFRRLQRLIEISFEQGFSEVSVFILSKQNLGRSDHELNAVFGAYKTLVSSVRNLCQSRVCRSVSIIGDVSALPGPTQRTLRLLSECTAESGLRLNFLAAYDAWDEIKETLMSKSGGRERLWVSTPVDAVIRSGGANLLSGFLPLQSQYAHLFTTKEMFNDLTEDQFFELVREATRVTHRFGR